MFASLLGSLSSLIIGLYAANKAVNSGTALAEEWFKFGASIMGTAFVTFNGTWGAAIIAHFSTGSNIWVCLVLGFGEALLATAALVAWLWMRSPLTRGIPIAMPMKVQQEVLNGGFSYIEPKSK